MICYNCWLLHETLYSVTSIPKKFSKLLLALGYHLMFRNLEFTADTSVFKSYFTYQDMTTTINFSYLKLPGVTSVTRTYPSVTSSYLQLPVITFSYQQLPSVTPCKGIVTFSYQKLPSVTSSYLQ